MIIKKIHRVLKFKQSAWLKPYINLNTELRKKATNTFEKDLLKAFNNIIFGKSIQSVRKQASMRLVNNVKVVKKILGKSTVKTFKVINKDTVLFSMYKESVTLNKPIYIGFVVLDLAKLEMYDFHYDIMKKTYGPSCELLMSDTDSLMYLIHTKDVYEDMLLMSHLFDTSEYPTDHFLFSEINKKVVGKMHDEANGYQITEFVGLQPKMYSFKGYKTVNENGIDIKLEIGKKTGKGINKNLKKHIHHSLYKQILFNQVIAATTSTTIRSRKHKIQTVEQTKYSLHPFDSKRLLCKNGIDTKAIGFKEKS